MPINPALQRVQDKYNRIDCPSIFDDALDVVEKEKSGTWRPQTALGAMI